MDSQGGAEEAAHVGGRPHFLRLLDSDEPFFSLKLCYDGERLLSAVLNGKPLEVEA